MTLTIEECEANGGHDAVPQPSGVGSVGSFHWETCSRCPAIREGLKKFSPPNSEIVWTEWGRWGLRLPPEESNGDRVD